MLFRKEPKDKDFRELAEKLYGNEELPDVPPPTEEEMDELRQDLADWEKTHTSQK